MKTFSEFVEEMQTKIEHKYGTYFSVELDSKTRTRLGNWCSQKNIKNQLPSSDFHTTVIYSRTPCPDLIDFKPNLPIKASFKKWIVFNENTLAIVLDSPELTKLHNHIMKKYGCSYDYSKYIPHISLSYDYSGPVPDKDIPFDFNFDDYTIKALESN